MLVPEDNLKTVTSVDLSSSIRMFEGREYATGTERSQNTLDGISDGSGGASSGTPGPTVPTGSKRREPPHTPSHNQKLQNPQKQEKCQKNRGLLRGMFVAPMPRYDWYFSLAKKKWWLQNNRLGYLPLLENVNPGVLMLEKKMRSFPESCFICLRLKGVLDAHKMDRDYNVLLLSVKTLQRVTSGEIKHIRNTVAIFGNMSHHKYDWVGPKKINFDDTPNLRHFKLVYSKQIAPCHHK